MKKSLRLRRISEQLNTLPFFYPVSHLDQMYKSHLDYCDIIYHIPSVQTQFGATLTDLMEKVERIQYQTAIAVSGVWQGLLNSITVIVSHCDTIQGYHSGY